MNAYVFSPLNYLYRSILFGYLSTHSKFHSAVNSATYVHFLTLSYTSSNNSLFTAYRGLSPLSIPPPGNRA
jgi:hypothetical protein